MTGTPPPTSTDRATRPRPPTRPWRPAVSALAFAIAAVLGLLARVGSGEVAVIALAVPMVMVAIGWVPLLRLPSPRGTTIVQFIAVALLLVPATIRPDKTVAWLPGAVAAAMIATFVHQLVRRDARPRLVESVSASVAGIGLLSSAVCLVPLVGYPQGRDAVTAVMAATAAATVADVGLGRVPRGAVAAVCAAASVVLGAGAAVLTQVLVSGASALPLVAVAGAVAGAASYAVRQVQSVLPSLWGRRAQFASAAASVLCTGAVACGLAWAAKALAV